MTNEKTIDTTDIDDLLDIDVDPYTEDPEPDVIVDDDVESPFDDDDLTPDASELRIQYMTLAELTEYPANPKDHDVPNIEGSISRFGFAVPFIVDERTGQLAAGHGRLKALNEMVAIGQNPPKYVRDDNTGQWRVPVVRGVSFNSDAEVRAFLIASNQLTTRGGWNDDLLAQTVSDLVALGPDMTAHIGFDQEEIDRLVEAAKDAVDKLEIDLSGFDVPETTDVAYKVSVFKLGLEQAETLCEELRLRFPNVEYEQYREKG